MLPSSPNAYVNEWLHWETQLHNHDLYFEDRGRGFQEIAIDPQYRSESSQTWSLPYVVVPVSECSDFVLTPVELSPEARGVMYTDESASHYRFFVHPFAQDLVRNRLLPYMKYVDTEHSQFLACPTSSLRSLVVWHRDGSGVPLMIKVSVFAVAHAQMRFVDWDAAWFHFTRGKWLRRVKEETLDPIGLTLLDESAYFGLPLTSPLVFAEDQVQTGQSPVARQLCNVVREFPQDFLRGNRRLLSCTAYMSLKRQPKTFIESIAEQRGMNLITSVEETLTAPLLKRLEILASKHGLTLEPHPQNILLELDKRLHPTDRIMFRDFGAVWLDPLRAFEKSPHLLHSLLEVNGGNPMEPFEADYSRFNVLRSIGTNFVNSAVYRALAALVMRGLITDHEAGSYAKTIELRVRDLIKAYFGFSPRCDPILPHLADSQILHDDLKPRLEQLTDLQKIPASKLAKHGLSPNTPHPPRPLLTACRFETWDGSGEVQWFRHRHGFVSAQGQHILGLVLPGPLSDAHAT